MRKGDKLVCPDGHVPTHGTEEGKSYPMYIVRRLGKKRSGRLLDGREWNEFPVPWGYVPVIEEEEHE